MHVAGVEVNKRNVKEIRKTGRTFVRLRQSLPAADGVKPTVACVTFRTVRACSLALALCAPLTHLLDCSLCSCAALLTQDTEVPGNRSVGRHAARTRFTAGAGQASQSGSVSILGRSVCRSVGCGPLSSIRHRNGCQPGNHSAMHSFLRIRFGETFLSRLENRG